MPLSVAVRTQLSRRLTNSRSVAISASRTAIMLNDSAAEAAGLASLHRAAICARQTARPRRDRIIYFLLFGLWPAGVLPDENGDGVAPPFLMFLSAFGFFFSLLLRI
jgi:hypothetical protein